MLRLGIAVRAVRLNAQDPGEEVQPVAGNGVDYFGSR
jgi:hypothetical protein